MNQPSAAGVPDPTCAGLLPALAPAIEGRDALWDDTGGRRLSRAALRADALALADELGRERRKLVFLEAANRASAVVGLLGAAAAGHVVALVDPALAPDKKTNLAALYRPDLIVHSKDDRPRIEVAAAGSQDGDLHPELLLLLSTSGTTGSAKFVRLSASAVQANAEQIAATLAIDPGSTAIAHLPLHYSYGLSVVTSHLRVGGAVAVIDDAVTSASFWAKVAEAGGTHFPGVPFHYVTLARLGFGLVPSGVTIFTQAGGALDLRFQSTVAARVAERGGRFFVMYGQTEAAPRITTLPADRWAEKQGSVGRALPGGMLAVLGPDGEEVTAAGIGPVVYRGPNVMMGYAEARADLALGDVMRGRLETGDLGRLDAEGYLTLTGRVTRFAKIAGLRLGLEEIEREIGAVLPVACLDGGDKIAVCFEGPPPDGLKLHLRAIAIAYKIPPTSFAMHQLDALPRKPSGKLDYASLGDTIRVRTPS